jgi:hypothetical protein
MKVILKQFLRIVGWLNDGSATIDSSNANQYLQVLPSAGDDAKNEKEAKRLLLLIYLRNYNNVLKSCHVVSGMISPPL